MGAWGLGIFEDDVALDARDAIYDRFRAGLSVRAATDAALEELAEMLEDEEVAPIVDAGRLDKRVKARALKIVAGGPDLRWQDDELAEQRRAVLTELGAKLSSPPPHAVPLGELPDA